MHLTYFHQMTVLGWVAPNLLSSDDGVGLHLTYFHQMTVLGCTQPTFIR
ncbi:protein of unknown function [Limnospira indica PCC 8005]|uniref:Uncharacterized protein n=1 Tax=Limnospira indica PCC 8005 TaxID=376219 RepID=A0A9P1NX84_9CYAN|nr:protein of unknown function [Limnospira indica PCC 8005]